MTTRGKGSARGLGFLVGHRLDARADRPVVVGPDLGLEQDPDTQHHSAHEAHDLAGHGTEAHILSLGGLLPVPEEEQVVFVVQPGHQFDRSRVSPSSGEALVTS